jgi:hypothetical protein
MAGISGEEEALLARLDRAFAYQRAALTARQLKVVRLWQRTDREYEAIQAVARGPADPRVLSPQQLMRAVEWRRELYRAIRTGRLPYDLTVYRGVRSLQRTFGVHDADAIEDGPTSFRGFTATSVLRRVALEEFTAPAGALMEIAVSAGTPVLWVAGVGSRRLRRQGELLLPDSVTAQLAGRRREEGLAILAMEVTRA